METEQANLIYKKSACKYCWTWINWSIWRKYESKEARLEAGITGPHEEDLSKTHECPKDANGKIIVNEENKKLSVEAKRVLGKDSPPASSSTPASGAAVPKAEIQEIYSLVNEILYKMDNYNSEVKKFNETLLRMEAVLETQYKIIGRFTEANPYGATIAEIIDKLVVKLDPKELAPKPASTLLDRDQSE